MPLLTTGSLGIDTIETPDGRAARNVLGGSAAYFAAAASFFTPTRLVAAVGADFPAEHLATLRGLNADTAGVEVRPQSRTFRWHGRYRADFNERDTVSVELGALGEAPPPIPAAFLDSRFIFLANSHPANQIAALAQFPRRRLAVADTMDLWIETERAALVELLRQVDGFVLNDSEARQLTGKRHLLDAADAVLALGPAFVVIKKGEHGAILRHRDGLAVLPAYPTRQVADPTGAGDTFAAGLMGHAAAHDAVDFRNLRRACAHGTVVASFTVEAFSLERLRGISRRDIDARLAEYKGLLAAD